VVGEKNECQEIGLIGHRITDTKDIDLGPVSRYYLGEYEAQTWNASPSTFIKRLKKA